MIIRGTPKNKDEYIRVDKYKAFELQQQGYNPIFIDSQYIYFRKDILQSGKLKDNQNS